MLDFLSCPLCWDFFMFSFHHLSFRWIGLLLCLAPTCRGQAKVVSARLNPSHGTSFVRGVCDFLGLPLRNKNLKWWTSVTAQLQLSSIWQAKDTTPSRPEGKPTPKDVKRREERGSILAPLIYMYIETPSYRFLWQSWWWIENILYHICLSFLFWPTNNHWISEMFEPLKIALQN